MNKCFIKSDNHWRVVSLEGLESHHLQSLTHFRVLTAPHHTYPAQSLVQLCHQVYEFSKFMASGAWHLLLSSKVRKVCSSTTMVPSMCHICTFVSLIIFEELSRLDRFLSSEEMNGPPGFLFKDFVM
jgi:hypothetical protein